MKTQPLEDAVAATAATVAAASAKIAEIEARIAAEKRAIAESERQFWNLPQEKSAKGEEAA